MKYAVRGVSLTASGVLSACLTIFDTSSVVGGGVTGDVVLMGVGWAMANDVGVVIPDVGVVIANNVGGVLTDDIAIAGESDVSDCDMREELVGWSLLLRGVSGGGAVVVGVS